MSPDTEIRVRVRLDFKGQGRPGRFLFGGKPGDRAAEEVREQQVALLRNVPVQGIHIEDIDMSVDVYTVWDDVNEAEVAYAPVIISIAAENIEDLLRFIAREDFRKIEVLEPGSIVMSRSDLERFLFKVGEEIKSHIAYLERKYNSR
ncbi:hypothetical protein [Desulfallas gibsoniae]|uniref:Uncharacterized protein n=1 Tax=Desulfoscipio gibsoniae DSM 7213 TaxID=767817 RepID=R4KFK5_9FIRM|nr:hypothetical protein Desgi_2552 [Desulfoscipio gibsoniae DSM 7213]